ncbi:MAG: ThiF family adenylyltransferase [Comamonadaceae bacterium]|nr:ThiF family adenylyltransferase [Comamonadaceae bacterium]
MNDDATAALLAPHPARRDRRRGPAARSAPRTRWSSAPAGWARRRRCTWPRPASAASTLVDDDTVDLTNLQRQIAAHHRPRRPAQGRLGARSTLGRDQPARSQVTALARARRRRRCSTRWCAQADVVLDCSDNFATRHAVNARLRARTRRPLVSGAAIRFDGQLVGVRPARRRRRPATPACSRPKATARTSCAR